MKREEVLQQVRSVVESVTEQANVRVYLFGSWARGEERVTSDIDLAIEGEDASEMAMQVREALEESNIPLDRIGLRGHIKWVISPDLIH